MATIFGYFPLFLLQIILFTNSVRGDVESTKLDNDTVKIIWSLKQNFNIPNIINEISQLRSSENSDCSNELSAISNGLTNLDEWAIKLIDAWGTFPSGIVDGSRNSLGSFSECFHIQQQNGANFKTQYCIGQLKFPSHDDPNKMKNYWSIFHDDSTISLGMCLPASCSIDRLEYVINEVIQRKFSDVNVVIHKAFCQLEENATHLNTFDFIVIGSLGIVLALIIASTTYDILYTFNHQIKYPLFVTFSIYTNGMKLFSCDNSKNLDVIECIRGIRVLSTMWIVFMHVYVLYLLLPIQETAPFVKAMETYLGKIAFSQFAVDSFFTLSGLLAAKKMFNMIKKNGKLNLFSLYLDRYMRLTPFLCICFLITMSLLPFSGNGPVWPTTNFFIGGCTEYWWSSLFYIQNYLNPNQVCFMSSWTLSVDMQLFLVAPAIAYFIHRSPAKTFVALFGLILGCIGLLLAVHVKHNFRNILEPGFVELSLMPTHLRFTSWLIGFITGYILSEYPIGSIRISKKLNLCGWILSLAMLAAPIFASYSNFHPYPTHTSFMLGLCFAICRISWAIALCYIIFACVHNAGGPINWFLSHSYWELFSKISYAIYLIHYPILLMTLFTTKAPLYFSDISSFYYFVGAFTITTFVSILATLAFEMPIDNIYKLIIKNNKQNNLNYGKCQKKIN